MCSPCSPTATTPPRASPRAVLAGGGMHWSYASQSARRARLFLHSSRMCDVVKLPLSAARRCSKQASADENVAWLCPLSTCGAREASVDRLYVACEATTADHERSRPPPDPADHEGSRPPPDPADHEGSRMALAVFPSSPLPRLSRRCTSMRTAPCSWKLDASCASVSFTWYG